MDNKIKKFLTKYNKYINFDREYRGIYITRVIIFFINVFLAILLVKLFTEEELSNLLVISFIITLFIIIGSEFGKMMNFKSIWK